MSDKWAEMNDSAMVENIWSQILMNDSYGMSESLMPEVSRGLSRVSSPSTVTLQATSDITYANLKGKKERVLFSWFYNEIATV